MKGMTLCVGLLVFMFQHPGFGQIRWPGTELDIKGGLKVKEHGTIAKSGPEEMLEQWFNLPLPTGDPVTEVSLACDESQMVIFFRKPRPSLNIDEGTIHKWNGSSWSIFASVTNECHSPDIDIDGDVVVATWNTDLNDYGYGSNINGPWVTFTGTYLQHQWYPRAAMAMGLPYMSFSCRYLDGSPSSYLALHVRHIVGPGDDIELNGGWRYPYYDIGMKTDLTGDDQAWYCVYTQQGYLVVDEGAIINGNHMYLDLGEGFRMNTTAYNPEIALFNGHPVVAWLEDSGKTIYVAEWNGDEWQIIGTSSYDVGSVGDIRMTSGDDLFIVYTINNETDNISVNRYDGNEWFEYPSPQDVSNTNIATADIALYKGVPVIAYTQGGNLSIKVFAEESITDVNRKEMDDQLPEVYPNPFHDYFTIGPVNGYGNVSYEILTVTGTSLIRKSLPPGHSVREAIDNGPGFYILNIYSENRRISSQRLIKF